MRLSSLQQFGFAVAVFALGCASSLWLESSNNQNPFYKDGALIAAPVGMPGDSNSAPRSPQEENDQPKEEIAKDAR